MEIEADGSAPEVLERGIDAAFDAVARVHRLMSFHEEGSDIGRINRYAATEAIAVDAWTIHVLRRALALFEITGGLFDCAVGSELMRCGLLPSQGLDGVEPGTSRSLILLPANRVRLSAPIAIDLGGIAKGFAVDRAVTVLRGHGIRDAVVNAGGDMRVIGASARTIHVRCTGQRPVLQPAGLLQNGAIATSEAPTTIARSVPPVRSCSRSNGAGSVYSVVAPNCLLADALTKVLIQTHDTDHPCFARLGACAFITSREGCDLQAH